MSRIIRRLYSSSSSSKNNKSATEIASQFLTTTQALPPRTQTQLLDANQLNLLSATLSRGREIALPAPAGGDRTPLPPCYHLAYFTPAQVERELAADGTDTSFNPPRPFTRRMWAGGELEWVGSGKGTGVGRVGNRLAVGQTVTESTRLVSAVGKMTRDGGEMVVVGVEKTFENEHGLALIDRRNWIFRPEITTPQAPAARPERVEFPAAAHFRDFQQTPVTLFRFSALTFNGHKIHYDKGWCREVEGHRDLVVHGPLNLINMVNLWRDVKGGDEVPRKVTYRATSPLYAGEPYRVAMDAEKDKVTEVKIFDSYGKTSMVGKIESF